jgi:predicted TPR repeat methyltransferase
MILIAATLLSRDWEQWDRGHAAATIDAYWIGSDMEVEHRKTLAALLKQWTLPEDLMLEIGCGSGLVYNQLVPAILPNESYVGVDISEAMLHIATARYPEGDFFKDDLFSLSFTDGAFEIVTAFEVFGHIGDIVQPIREMFRTSSRLMIFTVWTGPKTKIDHEIIDQSVFIRTTFSQQDVLKAIATALQDTPHDIHIQPLSSDKAAYIIHKSVPCP